MLTNSGHEQPLTFYRKMAELQERLRQLEEERTMLVEKYASLVKNRRRRNGDTILQLKEEYSRFLEQERQRKLRTRNMMASLEGIEQHAAVIHAKTEHLKASRRQWDCLNARLQPKIISHSFPAERPEWPELDLALDKALDLSGKRKDEQEEKRFVSKEVESFLASIDERVEAKSIRGLDSAGDTQAVDEQNNTACHEVLEDVQEEPLQEVQVEPAPFEEPQALEEPAIVEPVEEIVFETQEEPYELQEAHYDAPSLDQGEEQFEPRFAEPKPSNEVQPVLEYEQEAQLLPVYNEPELQPYPEPQQHPEPQPYPEPQHYPEPQPYPEPQQHPEPQPYPEPQQYPEPQEQPFKEQPRPVAEEPSEGPREASYEGVAEKGRMYEEASSESWAEPHDELEQQMADILRHAPTANRPPPPPQKPGLSPSSSWGKIKNLSALRTRPASPSSSSSKSSSGSKRNSPNRSPSTSRTSPRRANK